jgi:hypothetical protein
LAGDNDGSNARAAAEGFEDGRAELAAGLGRRCQEMKKKQKKKKK